VAASGFAGVEEDGGAPLQAVVAPAMMLENAAVEGPVSPGDMVAAVKEEMAAGSA
jgi:hypothetical protein